MKRTFLTTTTFLLFGLNVAYAQTGTGFYEREIAKNEVGLDVLNVLVFGALDVSYERILSEQTSLGLDFFSKVFNKNEGEENDISRVYDKDFSLTSDFKFYINDDKIASGFYAQAFGMLSSGENDKDVTELDPVTGEETTVEQEVEYTDFALGFGVGIKYVAKKGFLLDAGFGVGRNLFNKNSPDVVLLPTLNVGYRF